MNSSQGKIILSLEQDEAKYVQDVLKLTKTEIRAITRFDRGEALVCANNNKVPVVIKASEEENELITTDRKELETLLEMRKSVRRRGKHEKALVRSAHRYQSPARTFERALFGRYLP